MEMLSHSGKACLRRAAKAREPKRGRDASTVAVRGRCWRNWSSSTSQRQKNMPEFQKKLPALRKRLALASSGFSWNPRTAREAPPAARGFHEKPELAKAKRYL